MKVHEAVKKLKFPLFHYYDEDSEDFTTINTWDEVFKFFGITPNDVVMDTHPFYKNDKTIKCIIMASVWDMNDYMNDTSNKFAGINSEKYDWRVVETQLHAKDKWSAIIHLKEKKI